MIDLQNCIFWGETQHYRFTPRRHAFRYPLFFLCLEITELTTLRSRVLGYNRCAFLSLKDDDYLKDRTGSVYAKLIELLRSSGIVTSPAKTYLLTLPRFLGYVFNPVNFYISLNQSQNLHSFVAEVSNTFGETHTYVLEASPNEVTQSKYTFCFPKQFYVSPFLKTNGLYQLNLSLSPKEIEIRIEFEVEQAHVFSASLVGHSTPLTNYNLLSSIIKFPLTCLGTMLRIHWQAMVLIFLRAAPIFQKPAPTHLNTCLHKTSWVYSVRIWILQILKSLRVFSFNQRYE